MPADGRALAGNPVRNVAWPVRSGLVPPLAEGFILRPDTVPGLERALVALLRDSIACSGQALSPGDPLTRRLREALADVTGEVAAW